MGFASHECGLIGNHKLTYLEQPVLWLQIDPVDRDLDPISLAIVLIYIYLSRITSASNALELEVFSRVETEVPPHLGVEHMIWIELTSHVLYDVFKFERLSGNCQRKDEGWPF